MTAAKGHQLNDSSWRTSAEGQHLKDSSWRQQLKESSWRTAASRTIAAVLINIKDDTDTNHPHIPLYSCIISSANDLFFSHSNYVLPFFRMYKTLSYREIGLLHVYVVIDIHSVSCSAAPFSYMSGVVPVRQCGIFRHFRHFPHKIYLPMKFN